MFFQVCSFLQHSNSKNLISRHIFIQISLSGFITVVDNFSGFICYYIIKIGRICFV